MIYLLVLAWKSIIELKLKLKRPGQEEKLRRSDWGNTFLCVNKFGLHKFFVLFIVVIVSGKRKSGHCARQFISLFVASEAGGLSQKKRNKGDF